MKKYKLTYDETRIIIMSLLELRNQLIEEGQYTDAVDDIIAKLAAQACSKENTTMNDDSMKTEVPIWEKYMLTIDEACKYFNIGEKKMRRLAFEHRDNPKLILLNGSKWLIKREGFKKFFDETSGI